jgi:uncharacterized protein YbaP (TraB family)
VAPAARLLALVLALVLGQGVRGPRAAAADDRAADDAAPAAPGQADEPRPLLWVIDGGPARVFLYGTLHTNDPRVVRLPATVEAALAQSDGLFAELDLDRAMLADLLLVARLPRGQTLSALLPAELRARLMERLERLDQSLALYEELEPWVVWLTLQAAAQGECACEAECEGLPLDWRLYRDAKARGMTVAGLEEPAEQFAPFDRLGLPEQIQLLERCLDTLDASDAGEGPSPIERITQAWLAGDEHRVLALTQRVSGGSDDLDARVARRLLDERNARIASRLVAVARMSPGRTLFVALGAAHFAGPLGVLRQLRAHGYRARRIESMEELAPLVAPVRRCAPPPPAPRPCPPAPCPRRPRCGPFGLPWWR